MYETLFLRPVLQERFRGAFKDAKLLFDVRVVADEGQQFLDCRVIECAQVFDPVLDGQLEFAAMDKNQYTFVAVQESRRLLEQLNQPKHLTIFLHIARNLTIVLRKLAVDEKVILRLFQPVSGWPKDFRQGTREDTKSRSRVLEDNVNCRPDGEFIAVRVKTHTIAGPPDVRLCRMLAP